MAKTKKKAAKKAPKKAAKTAKKASKKKAAPKAKAKKAAPKKAAKKAAPKKAAPKKAAPKKAAPKKAAPKKAAPKPAPAPEAATPEVAPASAIDDAWSSPPEAAVPDPDLTVEELPVTNGGSTDRFRGVADALVADLEAAAGDAEKETAALQKAIDGYVAISGGGNPAELGLAEYFAEDGSMATPPALERVANATDDDILRWREKLADLAGY